MSCTLSGYTGGKYCSTESFFGEPIGLALCASSFSFTAANFLLQTAWDDAIDAGTILPIMDMKDFTDESTEQRVHDYPNEQQTFLAHGKYRFTAMFNKNQKQKIALQTLNNANWAIYIIYSNGVRGRTDDSGVTVKGIPLSMFNIGKETLKTMDAPAMIPVKCSVKNYKHLNEFDYTMPVSWAYEIDGLTEVDLSLGGVTPTAIALTIGVYTTIGTQTYGITGLAFADFAITGTGTLGVEGNFVDVGDGTYTFVTVGLINTDSVNLVSPSSIVDNTLHVVSSGAIVVTGIAA